MKVDDTNNSVEDMDIDNVHRDANNYVEDMDVDDISGDANNNVEDMDVDDVVDELLSVVSNPCPSVTSCLMADHRQTHLTEPPFNILCSTSRTAASMPCYLEKIAIIHLLALRAQVAFVGGSSSSNI
uniref:Uncharacterized protein n=1 Tax=Plectus sambesii TaxID=2011161 RepID=A0A914WJH0_9BILA